MTDLPLLLTPASPKGFQASFDDDVLSVRLDGPAALHGENYAGAAKTATVSWELNPEGYNYFRAFWRSRTGRGTLPFLIDVVLDQALPTRYAASFIPGTMRLVEWIGHRYVVNSQVELSRVNASSDLWTALNLLEQLVNVDFPENFGV